MLSYAPESAAREDELKPDQENDVSVANSTSVPLDEHKSADGSAGPFPLKGQTLDEGPSTWSAMGSSGPIFFIQSGAKKVEAIFGPKYQAAVVWEPNDADGSLRDFICFEPMAGVTNAINLNHAGKYPDLQTLAAGGKWTESFWTRASGI